ncbi:hypothetical protein HY991_03100 [Candidatus Micrarchaeota archaeon]|nr:hypothetical protein [Candidatus Micrarchaeota archaeon]
MLFPCEIVVKRFLPAMRAEITKELARKEFTQEEIAGLLGLTQAAVSKYLSGDYGKEIKVFEKNQEVREEARKIANEIADGKLKTRGIIRETCITCRKFRDKGRICYLHIRETPLDKYCELCKR